MSVELLAQPCGVQTRQTKQPNWQALPVPTGLAKRLPNVPVAESAPGVSEVWFLAVENASLK